MGDPEASTVEELAAAAELPLAAASVAAHRERLREFRALVDQWGELELAFRFEDGELTYAQLPAQFRPEWRGR